MILQDVPEPKLDQLYQEVILDHNRKPQNYKRLANATHHCHGINPLCGDDYYLDLVIDDEGTIQDIAFEGQGCAISKSSCSIMTTLIKGKPISEAAELKDNFVLFMVAKEVPQEAKERIGKMKIFEGVREFPVRIKCATLIWHALEGALNKKKN